MPPPPPRLCLCVLGLRCRPPSARPADPAPPPRRAWAEGPEAPPRGETDRASAAYRRSLELDPTLARNHLSLAAAHLGEGRDGEAAEHLAAYVRAEPGHVTVRGHYAELLLRLGRPEAAREQFERLVA